MHVAWCLLTVSPYTTSAPYLVSTAAFVSSIMPCPIVVVEAAIGQQPIFPVRLPQKPYTELQEIFSANCFEFSNWCLNGSFSFFITFFTDRRAVKRSCRRRGRTPLYVTSWTNQCTSLEAVTRSTRIFPWDSRARTLA